ncbi:cyclase, partial [bacterium]|nr:cyclase [bacterium]
IMVHVIVHHKVKDYAQWKEVFDEQEKIRKESGSKGARIFRDEKKPNNVAVLFQWNDIAAARTFFESKFLKTASERAGVIGAPEILFEVFKVKQ